jgi:Pentapeptide repeats (9 copies)
MQDEAPPPPGWPTCASRVDCIGAAIPAAGGKCLAHLDHDELGQLRDIVAEGGLDARGVQFTSALLEQVLSVLPTDHDGHVSISSARFTRASFAGGVNFHGAAFEQGADFERATFGSRVIFDRVSFDRVSFRWAQFEYGASFHQATFRGQSTFHGAVFGDAARFDRATFGPKAGFTEATFRDNAGFARATFGENARFDRAQFGHRANFGGASFGRGASFRKASFGVVANFLSATFGGEASFRDAVLGDEPAFDDARFGDGISFRSATFGRLAKFSRAAFGDRAWFSGASFGHGARFAAATFGGRSRFDKSAFAGVATFDEARFVGTVSFEGASCDDLTFRSAVFEQARRFGPVSATRMLSLDEASFAQLADFELGAPLLSAAGTRFQEGANIRVGTGEVALDSADFGGPSTVVPAPSSSQPPRVVSLRGTHVGHLTLSNLDLSACRFAGAHNLDGLRLEGEPHFSRAPGGFLSTRRQVLAEEQEWRAGRDGRRARSWKPPAAVTFPLERLGRVEKHDPEALASLYRSLRKGREDNADAPGAADFYYGEMEMRRHARRGVSRTERWILTLYWLVSGYGLRASRALVALLATIVVFALLLWWVGFDPRPSLTRSLLFSAGSTSSLFRVPQTPGTSLSEAGEALQIALRLLGPLFFGLALFSLRGRVKR